MNSRVHFTGSRVCGSHAHMAAVTQGRPYCNRAPVKWTEWKRSVCLWGDLPGSSIWGWPCGDDLSGDDLAGDDPVGMTLWGWPFWGWPYGDDLAGDDYFIYLMRSQWLSRASCFPFQSSFPPLHMYTTDCMHTRWCVCVSLYVYPTYRSAQNTVWMEPCYLPFLCLRFESFMMMFSSPLLSPNLIITFSPAYRRVDRISGWTPTFYHLDSSVATFLYLLLCINIHQSINPSLCPALQRELQTHDDVMRSSPLTFSLFLFNSGFLKISF